MSMAFTAVSKAAWLGVVIAVPAFAASQADAPAPNFARGPVAVRAGTIHQVEGGVVIEGGGTILIRDGRIEAVGKDLVLPPGVRVVDYGPDAVIVPGLVAAESSYGSPTGSVRAVDPFLRAIDNFDPYASNVFALQEGVTTAYLAPGRNRLLTGQGAVVKLGGADQRRRVLSEQATIHGSIGLDARNTPGYWLPPVPATADVGMGVEQQQMPHSLMGAVAALDELLALAQGSKLAPPESEYGPGVGPMLRELIAAKVPWRIGADSQNEILAALDFAQRNGQKLIIDGANQAGELADEILRAGVSVIVEAPYAPNGNGRNFGRGPDDRWPRYDAATKLARAGVRFAIATPPNAQASELRFAAALMSRGGLDPDAALRAITLTPAEILGVADRVGSITPGKDADLAVFRGHPMSAGAGAIATWVGGEVSFKNYETGAVVVSVGELHTGDGTVLMPGELLMQGGKIVEIGRKVGRPGGATVVHAAAAAPGMIDALGHLGLEGSTKVPPTRFDMKRLIEPGDDIDERVAMSGVTTVALSPRGVGRSGAPIMAYKPAGDDLARMVVDDLAAVRFNWTERNRRDSGRALKEALTKAVDYAKKWTEYEQKLATWTPPKEAPAATPAAPKKADDEAKKEEGEEAKKDGEGEKKEEKKDDKKKKKGEEEPPRPITGAWEAQVTVPPFEPARFRLYVLDEDGAVSGSLRCGSLSETLIEVSGRREGNKTTLSGEGSKGLVTLEAQTKDAKLVGKVTLGDAKVDFELAQTSTEYEVVRRPELRKPKEEPKAAEPKGMPKAPNLDPDLEPLRRAMRGQAALIVNVEREDEILAAVAACNAAGIQPVLYGASEAWKVADQLRGRVAGILLSPRIVATDIKEGAQRRNRYHDLTAAGIPVAFHSAAEEGAADLPVMAAYAVSQGMSPFAALRALTFDAARILAISDRVGLLAPGMDADVVLFDGAPLDPSSSVTRVWVDGKEVR